MVQFLGGTSMIQTFGAVVPFPPFSRGGGFPNHVQTMSFLSMPIGCLGEWPVTPCHLGNKSTCLVETNPKPSLNLSYTMHT